MSGFAFRVPDAVLTLDDLQEIVSAARLYLLTRETHELATPAMRAAVAAGEHFLESARGSRPTADPSSFAAERPWGHGRCGRVPTGVPRRRVDVERLQSPAEREEISLLEYAFHNALPYLAEIASAQWLQARCIVTSGVPALLSGPDEVSQLSDRREREIFVDFVRAWSDWRALSAPTVSGLIAVAMRLQEIVARARHLAQRRRGWVDGADFYDLFSAGSDRR